MYCVYVLKSTKDGRLYIGVTNDLKRRLSEHNAGDTKSTKHRGPFVLVYCEIYRSKLDALTRERKLKQFKNSYKELVKRIKGSLESA
ncbi:MAG: GIY-YIG nuclease family protein [Candidatus Liptonbacteria bacterium]|nr:GIY-YIG nuclease family protein [Candidatus Liptonbacteria bacterium]